MMRKKTSSRIEIVKVDASRTLPEKSMVKMIRQMLREQAPEQIWTIALIFTDDENITELNQRFFEIAAPTDVISFNLTENDQTGEGEVYISVETAAGNAEQYGVTLENELCRLAAHGVLHLLGYDDATEPERQKMTELENKALEFVFTS